MPPLSSLLVCVCRSSIRWVQAWAVSGNTNMRAVFFFVRETDRHSSWFYKQSAVWLIRTRPHTNTYEHSNKCMSIHFSVSVSPMSSHYNFSSLWKDSISFSYWAVINMLRIQEFRNSDVNDDDSSQKRLPSCRVYMPAVPPCVKSYHISAQSERGCCVKMEITGCRIS